ncbi:P2X purinoceptor 3 [Anomaloglossus baeobatrachus]|uniref:P2X purinoceptor 3 n=1 Tax=Anomaloglossus baeobatrachus TaxID=238106 RepID=UPI003F4FBE14
MMGCVTDFFTYETTKSVVVKSWTIGVINRAVQLLIITYFVCWVFLHEKAYQVRDSSIESSVMTKVKGVGRYSKKVMDVADYVMPPQGSSVFVILTKLITTPEQVQGYCPETDDKYKCTNDSNCTRNKATSNGFLTGRCVRSYCQIQGWCPTENDTVHMPILNEAENFTIFVKNSVRFPVFEFERGNLPASLNCRYHPKKSPFCPIFRLGDIISLAGQNFNNIAEKGGVMSIKIGWLCDLDQSWDLCVPRYSFTRLDGVSEKSNLSPGYNFRYARYFMGSNGSEFRTLIKAYGIRIDVLVYGNAGKFNIIPTLINIVAAFTSVGVGTVLCDIILLNFLKGADQYKAKKFEEISDTSPAFGSHVFKSDQTLGGRGDEKRSTDSGAFSIGL